jgi:putative ABC transport system permease protein
MTIAVRWRKLFRDFYAIQGRLAMAVAAIAIGVYAVATLASSYVILTREISRNYVETNPASALIDLGAVDPALVNAVRRRPDVSAAEAASIVSARVEYKPSEWVRLLLFVIPDFTAQKVSTVRPEAGSFPPKDGTILLEREALAFLGVKIGGTIRVETPAGPKRTITVSGTVHDPGLAPAWQEQSAYGYITPATLAGLGGNPKPELLKLVIKNALYDQDKVDASVTALARELRAQGQEVHLVQVPPTGRHPHQSQMTAVLAMFLTFAVLALILSAILTASMIDGLLAGQIRQIAVMKAIGARSGQITRLYLAAILAISSVAVLIGVPLGVLSGHRFADIIAGLLNFDIGSYGVPHWLIFAFVAGGLAIPLGFALVPIRKAARLTVREAISDYGVSHKAFGAGRLDGALKRLGGVDRTLIMAIRNAFRRRGRLILTLALLGTAGAMFLSSLSVQRAWDYFIAISAQDRDYDLELRLDRPVPADALMASVAKVPGVKRTEPWSVTFAAPARPDGLTLVRTYPDGGHGSLEFRSLPNVDRLSHLVFLEGGAPVRGEDNAILINQGAQNMLGRPHAGDTMKLTVEGRPASYRVAGVVRQIVALPAVFIASSGFQKITGTVGKTNAVHVVTADHDAAVISRTARTIEARLRRSGVRVVSSISETQRGGATGGHVQILVVSLLAMSVLMAIVGLLGLASALGISVAERTRELGIMRAIGGTSAVIIRNVVAEGLFIGLMSIVLAVFLAWPLATGIGHLVGAISFGLKLPFTLSGPALWLWLAIVTVGASGASLVPALSAARLTIRETLAYT